MACFFAESHASKSGCAQYDPDIDVCAGLQYDYVDEHDNFSVIS